MTDDRNIKIYAYIKQELIFTSLIILIFNTFLINKIDIS